MKLIATVVPPGLVEWRRRMGADGHDEMWQGVLHIYVGIGVAEVWIVDRDTREPEIYVSESGSQDYARRPPAADGWIRSDAIGIELRAAAGGKLGIRLAGDEATYGALPESQ